MLPSSVCVDIAYFRTDETLLDPGYRASHLFVIIKGHVTQFDGDELVASFGPNDCFDGRSLVAGRASSRFVAAETTAVQTTFFAPWGRPDPDHTLHVTR